MRVFLSYARADDGEDYDDPGKSLMRRLHDDLKAQGFDVWWDRVSLPSRGLSFGKEIEDAIRHSDRFVLVAGPGAAASDYVLAELRCARELCVPISILLRAGDHSVIPSDVSDINAIDIRPPREEAKALEDLASRLRQDAPLGKALNVRSLPTYFIERAEPFKAAHAALRADAISPTVISAPPRAAAIYGHGGIGKSTLAAALAFDCDIRRAYYDGVIWLEIGQKPDLQTRLGDIGVALGDVREGYVGEGIDVESARLRLSMLLREKHLLIVLDDVWDHAVVAGFPVEGTPCRLLITTRSGALARKIDGADIRLELLTPDEGAALIEKRAGAGDGAVHRQIVEALGGHTLAVTLAAQQIKSGYADSAADLLRMLTKRDNPFAHLAVDADDKDENLELSLSLSYTALPEDAQRRFRALGIFPLESSFDRAALAAVWGDADEDDARAPLQVLLGAGLLDALTPDPSASGRGEKARYGQHRLLRAYARALLEGEGEAEAVFGRYADVVTRQAAAFIDTPPEQWATLDPLLPHVDAVGEALVARWRGTDAPDEALTTRASEFAYAVTRYVRERRQMIETTHGRALRGLAWLEVGLEASRQQANQGREALFANEIGLAWDALGEQRKALEYYEQALPLDRALRDRAGEATTLTNIGAAWDALGEQRKALEYYQQALPVFGAVGDRRGEATTLTNIGVVWDALGEQRKALEYFGQALPLSRAVGDRGGEATTLTNIGAAWSALGEQRKALEYYEQALPLSRAVGDRRGEAAMLNNIGGVWDGLGEQRKALAYYEQALPLRRAVGDRRGEGYTLHNISRIYEAEGDLARAIEHEERATQLLETIEDANAGFVRAEFERMKRKRDGIEEPQDDPQAAFARQIMSLYAQGGAEAVRQVFEGAGATEEVIAAIIQQIEGAT